MDEDWEGDGHDVFDEFEVLDLPDGHPAKRHFGFGQNDADILGLEVGSDFLNLTICHYDVRRLACEFGGRFYWGALKREFPITFRFEGVSELVALRKVEQGVFQKVRCTQRSMGRILSDVRRMECISFEPGLQRYCLAVNQGGQFFRRSGQIPSPQCSEFVILIEAKELAVVEGYREGWLGMFGQQHIDVLDAFDAVWPVTSWGVPDFEKWLAEHNRQRSAPSH